MERLTFPVESIEPLVLLDVPDAALLVAQPLRAVVPVTKRPGVMLGVRATEWPIILT